MLRFHEIQEISLKRRSKEKIEQYRVKMIVLRNEFRWEIKQTTMNSENLENSVTSFEKSDLKHFVLNSSR